MADNALIRQKLESTLQASSLKQLVKEKRQEQGTFLLLDYSSSMDERVTPNGFTRKIDALRRVVDELKDTGMSPRQVGFGGYAANGDVRFIDHIPEPRGGTPLAEAIAFGRANAATHLVVVSDGRPDDAKAALNEAARFGGPVDIVYIGPEDDEEAIAFMHRLAGLTHGRVRVSVLADTKQLGSAIRGFLTA